jgi:hypothetical protein
MLHVPYKIYLKNQIIIDILITNKFISENKIKILIYIWKITFCFDQRFKVKIQTNLDN